MCVYIYIYMYVEREREYCKPQGPAPVDLAPVGGRLVVFRSRINKK